MAEGFRTRLEGMQQEKKSIEKKVEDLMYSHETEMELLSSEVDPNCDAE